MLITKLSLFPLALVAFVLIQADQCFADTIDLGFVQLISGSGPTAGFNIRNETGQDSSAFPDVSFPVTTSLAFSDLTLVVNFADGAAEEFDPSADYFSTAGVGQEDFDLATNPIESAFLLGTVGANALTLNNGSNVTISPDFVLIITDPAGSNLRIGDFALISASTVATPEPALGGILAAGLYAVIFLRRRGIAAPRGKDQGL
jgi:hypothetical protein